MIKLFFTFAMTALLTFSAQAAQSGSDNDLGVTWDIGGSAGKDTNDNSYNEVNLGLNLQKSFIEWRNAIFGRFITGQETTYGLDTSLHGAIDAQGETSGLRFFAGPGYRFVTKGENLPFAEAGLTIRLGGVSVGGGAKAFFNKMIDPSKKNETQYFVTLGGGGRL